MGETLKPGFIESERTRIQSELRSAMDRDDQTEIDGLRAELERLNQMEGH